MRTWLDEALLLPVLDGLDEVPVRDHARCITELRRYRATRKGLASTPAERRSRILDAYIRRTLDDMRPRRDDTPEQTLTWLTWLARNLTDRGEHIVTPGGRTP